MKNFLPSGTNATAFNPQLQHFDFICGQVMKENRILRFVVVISCVAFFLSIGICFYAIGQPDSIPVLVTMNDFGETKYLGPVSRKNYQNFRVPEIAVLQQVRLFIQLYNTLSTDRIVMNNSVNKAYHLLTSVTADKYSLLLKEQKPYEHFGERTQEVLFETDPLKLSADSYQVDYHVVERLLTGSIIGDKTYRALVSIEFLQPSEDDMRDNPLGIYISNFDFKLIDTKVYKPGEKF